MTTEATAQFGGGRGGRGGGRGGRSGGGEPQGMRDQMEALREFPIDALWSAISFGLELGDEQLAAIRPILANAWKLRKDVFTVAKEDDTWKAAKDRMKDLRKQVEGQLEQHLTKDQMKFLKKVQKDMRKSGGASRWG